MENEEAILEGYWSKFITFDSFITINKSFVKSYGNWGNKFGHVMNVFVLCVADTSTMKKIELGYRCSKKLVVRRLNLQVANHISLPLMSSNEVVW